jgi:hypothetical protein
VQYLAQETYGVPMPGTGFIYQIRNRVKEHMFLLSISHLLEKMGIKIVPYYITHELLCEKVEINLKPKISPVTCGFLSPA